MNENEYESYLLTFDLYLAEQCIDDQLSVYAEHYARLQQIDWDVRSKMYDIEQCIESLLTERQRLISHIKMLEQ
jgi:hypothetical protein